MQTSPANQPFAESQPHLGPAGRSGDQHEQFDAHELAIVLSHYDLGPIEQIRNFPRGSRRSPKLRIRAKRGEFLLKRRASGRSDPFRVAFAHTIQLHLGANGFPVAPLIGTREDNNSLLQHGGETYEMFAYVSGDRYDRSTESAMASGRALARMHDGLRGLKTRYRPAPGTYHGADMTAQFLQCPGAIARVEPDADVPALASLCASLREIYQQAAARVDALGIQSWQPVIIHGDWHPGNLLYRGNEIAAVIDFDSARIEPRVVDLANAALQFSMRMGNPSEPERWPPGFSGRLIDGLARGYQGEPGGRLERAEVLALPWLMVEALIVESIIPISATGRFARIGGSDFLRMVHDKIDWLTPRVNRLIELLS